MLLFISYLLVALGISALVTWRSVVLLRVDRAHVAYACILTVLK